jgi:hypothetical protein
VTFRPGLTAKTQELVERRIGEIEDKEKSLWQKYLDKKKKTSEGEEYMKNLNFFFFFS